MHNLDAVNKIISLNPEAYERLEAAKLYPNESFSEVVMRAKWPETAVTALEYMTLCRTRGPTFDEVELVRIERAKRYDQPAADKLALVLETTEES